MYVPVHFEVTDKAVLQEIVVKHPLGTWVVGDPDELVINHIPFLLDLTDGSGALRGHGARANPVWKQLSANRKSAVVFHAAQGYISPNWYPSKQYNPKVVPTWNYAVVHVHGTARAIEDKKWLLDHVIANTRQHEAHRDDAWQVSDAPAEYIEGRLAGIIGIEIQIESLQGKFKLSQNRSDADRKGIVKGLQTSGDASDQALARRMQQNEK